MDNGWKSYYVSNEQVLALLKIFRNSSDADKTKVQDLLVKRLTYLVQSKIKGYRERSFYSDLLQEGKIGLLRAMVDFDPLRGVNFFKYAEWRILHQIKMYLRWQKRAQRAILAKEENYFGTICEPDPHQYYEQAESQVVLREALEKLPELDRRVLVMRFGIFGSDSHTFKQIGEMYSVSKQRIEQIQRRAISRLKKNKEIRQFFAV
jgi:RNA polymerase sigma factor (sigma-70 family)